jgi:hypothetical protein
MVYVIRRNSGRLISPERLRLNVTTRQLVSEKRDCRAKPHLEWLELELRYLGNPISFSLQQRQFHKLKVLTCQQQ